MEAKRADPLQEALPALVLLGAFVVIMLVIFGGSNTSVEDEDTESDTVAAVDDTVDEGTADETTDEAMTEDVNEDPAEVVEDPGFKTFDTQLVSNGQTLYQVSCAGCHGMEGLGMPGLGKSLVDSEFVDELNADGFVSFVAVGRQPFDPMNSSGILMPARGGNPGLTDEDLHTIYTYLRAQTAEYDGDVIIYADDVGQYDNPLGQPWGEEVVMDTSAEMDTTDETIDETTDEVADVSAEPVEFVAIVPDGSIAVTDLPFDVAAVYGLSCAGCHGVDGSGVAGLAAPLADEVDVDAAFTLLTSTTAISDLDMAVGMVHPVRAEPAILTDDQLRQLAEYLNNIGELVEVEAAATGNPEWTPIIPDGTMAMTDLPFDSAAVYGLSCAGCHGVDGSGVEGLASPLGEINADAAFTLLTTVTAVSDLDMAAGMVHPVRAEPSVLTDDQLRELVDYLGTLGQ